MAEVVNWIKSLPNDELVQRLMNDYGYKCGPITVSTRSVYEKKLQSFINNTTISGKAIPTATQNKTNGSNDHHEVVEEEESDDAGMLLHNTLGRTSPRKGRKSLPLPAPSTRSKSSGDPMKGVKLSPPSVHSKSKRSIDLNFDDDEDSDSNSKSHKKSTRRVTITSPLVTPKVSGKRPVRISTPGPSVLSAYSSAEEDEDGVEESDHVNELPGHSSGIFSRLHKSIGSNAKSPKAVTPMAQGMPKARTSTPMTKMSINTSVFGNSSMSSASIGKRTSSRSTGSRVPSSLRVEPPSASSLASFSDDNDSENELGALSANNTIDSSSPPSVNLLRYRPRSSGIIRGPKFGRTPLANITTQATDYSMNKSSTSWSSFLSSSSASATSSPSSWISISILVVALIFFFSIFAFYFYSRITSPSQVQSDPLGPVSYPVDSITTAEDEMIISKLKAPICSGTQSHLDSCLDSRNHIRPAYAVVRHLAQVFEVQCVSHFCEASSDDLPAHHDPTIMSIDSFRTRLVPKLISDQGFRKLALKIAVKEDTDAKDEGSLILKQVNRAITDSLILLEHNPKFKIKVVRNERSMIDHLKIDLKTFPIHWPWMCRFTMAIIDAIWMLTVVSAIMFASFCLYYFINLSKRRRSEEEELKYELIEKSLELLQSPDEPQSMPILHIRDTLISPLDRTDAKNIRVWNEVVKFIEENESRVKIDSEVIDGETYRTWKWVASPMDTSQIPGSMKTGDIEWQGQAFNDNDSFKARDTRRSTFCKPSSPAKSEAENFTAPTCFIKARNLFDLEMVRNNSDSSWQTSIRDAVLQKCALRNSNGDHGILHMYFETEHQREALVYMKCKDIESASNAYLALHGWWCERKLVSVRFLKEDRYYQRFPDARDCFQSLTCTSTKD